MATDEKEKDHVKGVWKKTVTITKKILGDRKPIGCYIAGEFPYPIHEVGIMAITYFSRDYNKYQLITIRAPTWKVDLGQVFAQHGQVIISNPNSWFTFGKKGIRLTSEFEIETGADSGTNTVQGDLGLTLQLVSYENPK